MISVCGPPSRGLVHVCFSGMFPKAVLRLSKSTLSHSLSLSLYIYIDTFQYAGSSLKELQKAIKSPAANLGILLDAGSKRAKR